MISLAIFGPYEDGKKMFVVLNASQFERGSLKLDVAVQDNEGNVSTTDYELVFSPEGDGPTIFLVEDDIPNHYLPLNGVDK